MSFVDLSSVSRTCKPKPAVLAHACNASTMEAKMEGHWLDSIVQCVSSRLVRDPASNIRQIVLLRILEVIF